VGRQALTVRPGLAGHVERSGRGRRARERPRRRLLAAAGGAAVAGAAGIAGGRLLTDPDDAPTEPVESDRARELAERFAPDLHFDARELWYPTDPLRYAAEVDDPDAYVGDVAAGDTVVDGFTAYDEYSRERRSDPVPEPTVFHHVVRYADSPLAVVQFWMYAAFDQFTTNFHWHDWEVLHVFVDVETDEPQLYVASAHGRSVPNNEFLDPDPERTPAIVSELGSHSSGLSVNDDRDAFQRFAVDGLADITNQAFEAIESLAELPVAYGLPRDEGVTLAFAVPELDGAPIHEHPELPAVTRDDLVDPAVTVRSFDGLVEPPAELPRRETGLHLTAAANPTDGADREYDLRPTAELEGIDAFTGPRLSFEFSVPSFAEDAIAGHLSAAGTPWDQPRYDGPAADVTDPNHRRALADRYDAIDHGGPITAVAGAIREAVPDEDAPDGNGTTLADVEVGALCLLESDPEAVPAWGRGVAFRGVEPGEHRLTVNAPGAAPYAERIDAAAGETTPAGAAGDVTLVANRAAVKLDAAADADGPELARVRIEDDFGGRQFDFRPDDPGEFAVHLHREGAYTAEIRDADGEPGAYRVNPDPAAGADGDSDDDGEGDPDVPRRTIDRPRTGKASLAAFVASIATETAEQLPEFAATAAEGDDDDDDDDEGEEEGDTDDTDDDATPAPGGSGGGTPTPDGDTGGASGGGVEGLQRALEAAAASARRAAARAEESDAPGADRALEAARERLARAADRLDAGEFSGPASAAVSSRLDQADRRARQALDSGKPN